MLSFLAAVSLGGVVRTLEVATTDWCDCCECDCCGEVVVDVVVVWLWCFFVVLWVLEMLLWVVVLEVVFVVVFEIVELVLE